ncbi:hypothetical protein M662_19120 [Bacillus sp. SB49]|uniref:hypothetical protein n=1 Tax=Bacillus sp. SB49 TaxID=1071080 RepID=UPI00047E9B87|nr:hypothetical protein [Bacillus sp. SB49]QHT48507.1 hypothetical protein M662_19120 [Bacillus sp. SB49]
MANKKMNLSKTGKELLENAINSLDLDRPLVIKIALAKGLAYNGEFEFNTDSTPKWPIPEGIIKNNEYLMFKHIIINNLQKTIEDQEVSTYMLHYLEKGLRVIDSVIKEKNSLEDSRFVIL